MPWAYDRLSLLPLNGCIYLYHLPLFIYLLTIPSDTFCRSYQHPVLLILHGSALLFSLCLILLILCTRVSSLNTRRYTPLLCLLGLLHILDFSLLLYFVCISCNNSSNLSRNALIFSIVHLCFWILYFFCSRQKKSRETYEMERSWSCKCKWMYRFLSCRLFKKRTETERETFNKVGSFLTKLLTIETSGGSCKKVHVSDITFGLHLVQIAQKRERTVMHLESNGNIEHLNEMTTMEWQRLSRYGTLSIGVYGWKFLALYKPFRFSTLFCCTLKSRKNQKGEADNGLFCSRKSFLGLTRIASEDLLYLNCKNKIFQSPYAIVKQPKLQELIFIIRGTLSLNDILVDACAHPLQFTSEELPHLNDVSLEYTHAGILQTARHVLAHIENHVGASFLKTYVLDLGWKLSITGHSLGAGIATVLAILLKKQYTNVQCFAIAPPPLLSPKLAVWSRTFITTVVYGDDLVPRCSLANVDRLRHEMKTQYEKASDAKLYKVYIGRHHKEKKDALIPWEDQEPSSFGTEMDLPGMIVHIEGVKRTKKRWFFKSVPELQHSIKTAKDFKRIWITTRGALDHFPHNYTRSILTCAEQKEVILAEDVV